MRLQSLSLVGNRMQNLTCHMFRPLATLQHLDLSGNKISEISYCSFNGLLKLKSLLLQSNQLEFLDNNLLKDLEYLERLNDQTKLELEEKDGELEKDDEKEKEDKEVFKCNLRLNVGL